MDNPTENGKGNGARRPIQLVLTFDQDTCTMVTGGWVPNLDIGLAMLEIAKRSLEHAHRNALMRETLHTAPTNVIPFLTRKQ